MISTRQGSQNAVILYALHVNWKSYFCLWELCPFFSVVHYHRHRVLDGREGQISLSQGGSTSDVVPSIISVIPARVQESPVWPPAHTSQNGQMISSI